MESVRISSSSPMILAEIMLPVLALILAVLIPLPPRL